MPSTNSLNTNKFKPHIRSANRCRLYPNTKDAFYQRTDGTFIRSVPVLATTP